MKTLNSNHKVAIFCGSMFGSKKEFKEIAIKVTEYLSKKNYDIVYGGGENGLMGVVANTAIKNKAHVTGIIPEFLDRRETIHRKINRLYVTKTMEQRKKKFFPEGKYDKVPPKRALFLSEKVTFSRTNENYKSIQFILWVNYKYTL